MKSPALSVAVASLLCPAAVFAAPTFAPADTEMPPVSALAARMRATAAAASVGAGQCASLQCRIHVAQDNAASALAALQRNVADRARSNARTVDKLEDTLTSLSLGQINGSNENDRPYADWPRGDSFRATKNYAEYEADRAGDLYDQSRDAVDSYKEHVSALGKAGRVKEIDEFLPAFAAKTSEIFASAAPDSPESRLVDDAAREVAALAGQFTANYFDATSALQSVRSRGIVRELDVSKVLRSVRLEPVGAGAGALPRWQVVVRPEWDNRRDPRFSSAALLQPATINGVTYAVVVKP